MISRMHRFHGFNALRHVYTRGQSVRGPFMTAKFIFNNKRTAYRMAVVVSRKVHKSAIVRNRIRRRIYEIVRRHETEISEPYDIVITVFNEQVADIESRKLEAMLLDLFIRAHLIKGQTKGVPHAIVETKRSA